MTNLSARAVVDEPIDTRRLADGLLAQGTLPVAIAVVLAQAFDAFASIALTTVLVGVFLGNLFAWRRLREVLIDASELDADQLDTKLGLDFEEETRS
ncbi:MAG: hypothetical protein MUC50_10270 [Myxococcota bacterium]|nr:hypothetical protein [Myxococcota bacterium]